ncbi:MAG: hypothetical protein AAB538_03920, partial [Patescibacteria group bacterium]
GQLQYWEGNHKTYLVTSDANVLESGMTVGHPTVFVRRASYERFGLFRLDFCQAMDYEWLLRAKVNGARFVSVRRCIANMQDGGLGDRLWYVSLREVARARTFHLVGTQGIVSQEVFYLYQLGKGAARRFLDAVGMGFVRRIHQRFCSPIKVEQSPPSRGTRGGR